jgi:hypothetical protein
MGKSVKPEFLAIVLIITSSLALVTVGVREVAGYYRVLFYIKPDGSVTANNPDAGSARAR